MKAIILVGGEGTRLRPLTLHRLKSTVPMVGRPFLEYQFALLKKHGVRDIALSICHKPELIRRAFGTGSRYGVRLGYAVEKKPLGTAGAIKNAEKFVKGKEPIAVLNGDELTDWDLTRMAAVHQKNKAILTIGLTWVEDPSAYGLVLFNSQGRVQRFVEKPNVEETKSYWINAGLYIFDPQVFDFIPENAPYSAERELFPKLLTGNQRVWSFTSRGYWKDIGTPGKYHQAHMDILEGRLSMLAPENARQSGKRIWLGKGCKVHATARIFAPSVMGAACQIAEEAQIGEFAVLGSGVKVGPRASLEQCVIWEDVTIGEGSRLTGCVLGSGCKIGKFVTISPGQVLGDCAVVPDFSKI